MDNTEPYTTNVGDLLVINIEETTYYYIAEVTLDKPLQVKVSENMPIFKRLSDDEIHISHRMTKLAQGSHEEQQQLLRTAVENGNPLRTGLEKLGFDPNADTLFYILPAE